MPIGYINTFWSNHFIKNTFMYYKFNFLKMVKNFLNKKYQIVKCVYVALFLLGTPFAFEWL